MSQKKADFDFLVKLLIIGDSGVGKTCLLMRYCENLFTNNHLTTIGIDFKLKTIEVGGKKVKIQIWDTAGQERFRTITQTYYKGAQGIILVYGVDDKVSFQSIENWMKQINTHAQEGVSKLLVANKSDCADRVVQTQEGQRLADQYGIPFFETSAKNGTNIYEIFNSIAKMVIDKQNKDPLDRPSNVQLSQQPQSETQKKQGGCC
ncbi:unnamed protein product [Paramecium octaurelia]|uniref:Ras-related protein Rab-1 n=1 Tax=Paramecium octaurelia TaxID=43137 RepID=A0A8S1SXV8_PAROT|nr:unnamed protein product [Paramecium octaurelia]